MKTARVLSILAVAVVSSPLCFAQGAPTSPMNAKAGVWREGFLWVLDVNGDGQFVAPPDRGYAFGGITGDIPLTGVWQGNVSSVYASAGIFRPVNGLFILDTANNGTAGTVYSFMSQQAGDIPVVGDWSGSGTSKIGIFRQGFLWLLDSNGDGQYDAGDAAFAYGGIAGDVPVAGDWTGSGRTSVGVFRQGFLWVLDANGDQVIDAGDLGFAFGGIAGDIPVVGKWNPELNVPPSTPNTLSVTCSGVSCGSTTPGSTSQFTFTYNDPVNGSNNIQYGQVWLADSAGGVHCQSEWGNNGALDLFDGNPSSASSPNTTLSDSFCSISLASVTEVSTTALAVTLNMNFLPAAAGRYNVVSVVYDLDGDASPFGTLGTFTVTELSIGGQLTLSGAPLAGVNMTLSGSQSGSTTTDANGNWSFSVIAGGSYTVTPSSASYTFTPASLSFSGLITNQVASFQPAVVPPTLTININNTATTSDDIAVLFPAQTIPAQITLAGASGAVQLSATPAGRVSISPTTLNLTNGVPGTVTIVPLQQSQAANDVQIIATFGAITAQGSVTVVSVAFPAISNADTPAGMPNRIPPTAITPIQVTVQPNLAGSGQTVTLGKLNNGGNNGDFTIGGDVTQSITATTTVNLQGTTQTAATAPPGGGNAGNLQLVATVHGQNAVQSYGFSVAAIPINWTDAYSQTYTVASPTTLAGSPGPYIGLEVLDGWSSDSGSGSQFLADLDQVQLLEQVHVELGTGVLTGIIDNPNTSYMPARLPAGMSSYDSHILPSYVLTGEVGFTVGPGIAFFNQTHIFLDLRTGVTNIPIPNSGFGIGQAIAYTNGAYQLTTSKAGSAELANGYASGAGTVTPNTAAPNLITVTIQQ